MTGIIQTGKNDKKPPLPAGQVSKKAKPCHVLYNAGGDISTICAPSRNEKADQCNSGLSIFFLFLWFAHV
jgi:hypothetical protein